MQNGLYKVGFQTPIGQGAGVVVLSDGKLEGGDAGMFYIGTYSTSGTQMAAEVATGRHTSFPDSTSVFGMDVVHITLTGTFSGTTGMFEGKAKEAPGLGFHAQLTKLSV